VFELRGGDMKKKRRVEIQIEHREFSMFAAMGAPQMGHWGSGPEQSKPDTCSTCGSAGMLPLADALLMEGWNAATIQRGVENGSFHLQLAASGQWWLCKQSLPHSALARVDKPLKL
jgi:hypothetical protein